LYYFNRNKEKGIKNPKGALYHAKKEIEKGNEQLSKKYDVSIPKEDVDVKKNKYEDDDPYGDYF
jgi:hypothetical protein